jgi:hypothetical protein
MKTLRKTIKINVLVCVAVDMNYREHYSAFVFISQIIFVVSFVFFNITVRFAIFLYSKSLFLKLYLLWIRGA